MAGQDKDVKLYQMTALEFIKKRKFLFFIIMLIIVLLGWQHVMELRGEEPRRAVVSMEMILSRDYIVPKIHGEHYYNKPPIFNWVLIFFMWIFDSFSEWVVRLPGVLSYLMTGCGLYFIGKRYITKEVAISSTLIFFTMGELLFFGTIESGEIDLFFMMLTFLQVIAIYVGLKTDRMHILFMLSYFLAAVGTLTKGPPSIAFQALTILPYLIYTRKWKLLFTWHHVLGIVTFTSIVFSYFIAYNNYDSGIAFANRLIKEASQRSANEHSLSSNIIGIFQFIPLLAKVLLPWTFLFLLLFSKKVRRILWKNDFIKFSILFIAFNLPVYWISGEHKPRYIYMFFPFIAVILAFAYSISTEAKAKIANFPYFIIAGLMGITSLAMMASPFFIDEIAAPHLRWKCIFFGIFSFSIIAYSFKQKKFSLWPFAFYLLLMRLMVNVIYIPLVQEHNRRTVYREDIKKLVVEIDEPITLSGAAYSFPSKVTFLGTTIAKSTHKTPPVIPYSIPYYYTRYTNEVLNYTENINDEKLYIVKRKEVGNCKIVYEFTSSTLKDEWTIIRCDM